MLQKGILILDPTEGPVTQESELVPRLNTLEGRVLGIINNSKPNSDLLLRGIAERLQKDYRLEIIWVDKTNASLPAPPSILEQLKSCHAVLAGVGD